MIKFKPDWRRKKDISITGKLLSPTIFTERLVIQAPTKKDYQEWSVLREKNRNFLKPYEPEWPKNCLNKEFFERRLQRQEKDREQNRGAYFFLKDRQCNQILGGVNLNNIQMGAMCHASLGYWLDEDAQRKGYMQEAIQEIIDYSFGTLRLKRLNAACLPDNERSINMLLKLNFEEEGYARNYFEINGRWQDHRLFGLVR